MVLFRILATLRDAQCDQTTTWHPPTPSQCIRIADDKCVREDSTSVMHASGRAPGLQTK